MRAPRPAILFTSICWIVSVTAKGLSNSNEMLARKDVWADRSTFVWPESSPDRWFRWDVLLLPVQVAVITARPHLGVSNHGGNRGSNCENNPR